MSTLPKRIRASSSNAGPVQKDCLGKTCPEYTEGARTATITAFPLDWKTRRSLAAVRLAEVIRLAQGRREHGLRVDPGQFVWILAATLGSAAAGPYGIGKRHISLRWYGLNLDSLRHSIKKADLGAFSDDELLSVIRGIEIGSAAHGPKLMRGEKVGLELQVTAAERELFDLRTIEACDESREDRKARQAEARRKKDRERKRVERGRTQRPVFEAGSQEHAKPWEAVGISRATWFRRKRETPHVQARSLSLKRERTHESHRNDTADEGGAEASGAFLKIEKKKMQIMFQKGSPPVADYVPENGGVAELIDRAASILKAQRPSGPRFYNDPLEETLTLLGGLSMIARFERQDNSEVSRLNLMVAATESAKLIKACAANDNRLIKIALRLAA